MILLFMMGLGLMCIKGEDNMIKDKIINFIQMIVKKITKKTCDNCTHCVWGSFCDNIKRYELCSGIYPHGFEQKQK